MNLEGKVILTIVGIAAVAFVLLPASTVALIALASLTLAVFIYGYVFRAGRRLGRARKAGQNDVTRLTQLNHTDNVTLLTVFILIGVVGIEVAVRKEHGLWGNPLLLAVHLSFVLLSAAAFLIARFKVTGLKDPKTHWKFAYTFFAFFLCSLITGAILLFQHFHYNLPSGN